MPRTKPLPKNTWYDEKIKRFCKYCPDCNETILDYSSRNVLANAIRLGYRCDICRHNLPEGSRYDEETKLYYRPCPNCEEEIPYKTVNSLKKAENRNSHCPRCQHIRVDDNRKDMIYKKTFRYAWMHSYKRGADSRKYKWDITEADVYKQIKQQKGKCYYTELELESGLDLYGKELKRDVTASIDRVNNDKGYEVGNVVICHKVINKMKQNMSLEKFQAWCALVTDKMLNDMQ